MNLKQLEEERLWDWFSDKYDWESYKEAEKELNEKKKDLGLWRRSQVTEEERLWLIKRTKEILRNKWDKKKEARR